MVPGRGVVEQLDGIEAPSLGNSRRTSSFMGVNRDGFSWPCKDSKYSSARLTPSQSKRSSRRQRFPRCRLEALAVAQVHELSPVQVRVFEQGGLLAPFRVIRPELLADVRQLQPGVDQDPAAMAALDEAAEIVVAAGIRLVEVPRRHVEAANTRQPPALGKVVQVRAGAIGGIEEGPQPVGPEGRREPQFGKAASR